MKTASHLSCFAKPFDIDVTLPSDPAPELAMRWGGYQYLPAGNPPTRHENYPFGILVLILSGSGFFSCGDQQWDLAPGTLFWASPGLTTKVSLREGSSPLVHYVVMPCGTSTAGLISKCLGSPVGADQVANPDALARLFEVILDEGTGNSPHREGNCRDLIRVLFRRLENALVPNPRKLASHSRDTFERARFHIQTNFADIRDLGDVAEAIGVSTPYLCRLFERYDNQSAFDFLTHLKLTKATRLLSSTDLSIETISKQVGYTSLSIFSRNFRKMHKVSPSSYRRSHSTPPEVPPSP